MSIAVSSHHLRFPYHFPIAFVDYTLRHRNILDAHQRREWDGKDLDPRDQCIKLSGQVCGSLGAFYEMYAIA